jgi:hypothetical protein
MTPSAIPYFLASAFNFEALCWPLNHNKHVLVLSYTKNKTQFGSIAFPLMENQQQQRQPASVKSRFRRVCVFCGSSPGKNPSYQLAAIQLGKQLVPPKTTLSFFFIFELNERMRASSGTGFLIRPPTSEHHVLLTWHDLFFASSSYKTEPYPLF